MKRFLESRGFMADGYELPLSKLEETQIPAIVLVIENGYHHFVVVKGVRGSRVLIGDPATGTRAISREHFNAIWDSQLLFVIHNHEEAARFNRPPTGGSHRAGRWRWGEPRQPVLHGHAEAWPWGFLGIEIMLRTPLPRPRSGAGARAAAALLGLGLARCGAAQAINPLQREDGAGDAMAGASAVSGRAVRCRALETAWRPGNRSRPSVWKRCVAASMSARACRCRSASTAPCSSTASRGVAPAEHPHQPDHAAAISWLSARQCQRRGGECQQCRSRGGQQWSRR